MTLLKVFVCCMLAAASAACAYGSGVYDNKWMPGDAGAHFDASPHDAYVADVAVDQGSLGPPDTGQTQICTLTLPTGLPSCDACLQMSCCAEDDACGSDPSCLSLISCMDGCLPTDGGPPDATCMNTCQTSYPTGASELSTLDSCMSVQCRTACGGP